MPEIVYPDVDQIIEYNLLALKLISVKKADQAKVLSRQKIIDSIEECRNLKGSVEDKAVCLLKSLVQKHPFASGNRRTAVIVTKEFLLNNHAVFRVKDDPSQARVLQGIRENYYSDEEIKEWFTHGKIREFKR